jgi:hypothetical protein
VCLWAVLLLVSSWSVWICFARICEGFFFLTGCVLGVFLFQGLEKSLEALWNICCVAAVATGLTGAGHRSDRCSTGSKPCKFPLCVLVCFGLEGCLFVSSPVVLWS